MRLLLTLSFIFLSGIAFGQFDYSVQSSWYINQSAQDSFLDKRVDVFFVHPTTYYRGRPTNELKIRPTTMKRLEVVERNQVAAFVHEGRVFMPHYRQASLANYLNKDTAQLQEALDLAYSDVRRAFAHYLTNYNNGRPFILASHSQGSGHAFHLLREFLDTGEFHQKLVAAYIPGMPMSVQQLELLDSISMCSNALQTGCLTSWMSVDNRGQEAIGERRYIEVGGKMVSAKDLELVCTNPISWSNVENERVTGFEKRALYPRVNDDMMRFNRRPLNTYVRGAFVRVEGHDRGTFNGTFGNLHIYDYNLFFGDIQLNVTERINSYLDGIDE